MYEHFAFSKFDSAHSLPQLPPEIGHHLMKVSTENYHTDILIYVTPTVRDTSVSQEVKENNNLTYQLKKKIKYLKIVNQVIKHAQSELQCVCAKKCYLGKICQKKKIVKLKTDYQ